MLLQNHLIDIKISGFTSHYVLFLYSHILRHHVK